MSQHEVLANVQKIVDAVTEERRRYVGTRSVNWLGLADRFWSKVEKGSDDQCWLWKASHGTNGYGQFEINRRPRPAHRVAYELSKGAIPEGLFVMHSCDIRSCCNPAHLTVGTPSDNSRDMVRKNRMVFPQPTKLNDLDVLAIHASSERVTVLARKYGVTHGLISGIRAGRLPKRWRNQ